MTGLDGGLRPGRGTWKSFEFLAFGRPPGFVVLRLHLSYGKAAAKGPFAVVCQASPLKGARLFCLVKNPAPRFVYETSTAIFLGSTSVAFGRCIESMPSLRVAVIFSAVILLGMFIERMYEV